jgi:uncharacterized protein (DUF427 family)
MAEAIWNGVITPSRLKEAIAFDRRPLRAGVLRESGAHSVCPWKGTGSYGDPDGNGERNAAPAWHYPDLRPAAIRTKDRVAL